MEMTLLNHADTFFISFENKPSGILTKISKKKRRKDYYFLKSLLF